MLLVSRKGQAVRFRETRPGPWAAPRAASRDEAAAGDEVISIDIAHDDSDLLVVTENGYGKRTPVADYPRKGRGTMGVLTIRLVEARGAIMGVMAVHEGQELMFITQEGSSPARPSAASRAWAGPPRA